MTNKGSGYKMKKVRRAPLILMLILVFNYCIMSFNVYETRLIKEKWSEDFAYIVGELELFHPDPWRVITKETFEQGLEDLVDRSPSLRDEMVIFELQKIVASLKDGHTNISFANYANDYFYPIKLQVIDEKVYITKTSVTYEEYRYAEVTAINGQDIYEIIEKALPYFSAENQYFRESALEQSLYSVKFLELLGVVKGKASLRLEIILEGEPKQVEIAPMLKEDFYEMTKAAKPAIKGYGVENYSYELLEEEKILIFRFNSSFEDENIPIERFNDAFWIAEMTNDIDKLVIDISRNVGGYRDLFDYFFDEFATSEYNAPGKTFVIIGKGNYSAGTIAVSKLKRLTDVTLIGEPSGGAPIMTYAAAYRQTPNKQVKFYIARGKYENYPDYPYEAIMPDVEIIKTIEDYKRGVDPYLDYVKGH